MAVPWKMPSLDQSNSQNRDNQYERRNLTFRPQQLLCIAQKKLVCSAIRPVGGQRNVFSGRLSSPWNVTLEQSERFQI